MVCNVRFKPREEADQANPLRYTPQVASEITGQGNGQGGREHGQKADLESAAVLHAVVEARYADVVLPGAGLFGCIAFPITPLTSRSTSAATSSLTNVS